MERRSFIQGVFVSPFLTILAASTLSEGLHADDEIRSCGTINKHDVNGLGNAFSVLHGDLTFSNLTIHSGNRCAVKILKNLACSKTPQNYFYVISGPEGYGKTHLLHATLNQLRKQSERSIVCLAAERYCALMANGKSTESVDAPDIFALDECQFLYDKPIALDRFLRDLRELQQKGVLTIIVYDPVCSNEDLKHDIFSYLGNGQLIYSGPPSSEEMFLILKNACYRNKIHIPDLILESISCIPKVYDFPSGEIKGMNFNNTQINNVRAKLGLVNRIVATSRYFGICVDAAWEWLTAYRPQLQ